MYEKLELVFNCVFRDICVCFRLLVGLSHSALIQVLTVQIGRVAVSFSSIIHLKLFCVCKIQVLFMMFVKTLFLTNWFSECASFRFNKLIFASTTWKLEEVFSFFR